MYAVNYNGRMSYVSNYFCCHIQLEWWARPVSDS